MTIVGATLFSGIGAPEVAAPHWRWAWCAEIEKFPSAVMAVRHPHSINLGDVSADDFAERAAAIAIPDVIVFGSPCQDFSVAGKRLGLGGARGNLALTALRIVARLRPRWFVFENVPGLLSNWSGGPQCPPEPGSSIEGAENSDFAAFLGCVDELGYSGAWASLDAQYRGLAQRRDRLFFVGHSGDWRHPAAVLFEPESLCGDTPPSRQTGQDIAGSLGAGSERSGGRVGRREAAANQLIAGTLTSSMGRRNGQPNDDNPADYLVAHALNAHGGPCGRLDYESETFVTHALRADGFDASEDGTGRGTPLVTDYTNGLIGDVAGTLEAAQSKGDRGHGVLAFDTTQITSKENRCQPRESEPCHPLAAGAHAPAIALQEIADPITAVFHKHHGASAGKESIARNHLIQAAAVRRLTPRECERLQGYPDDYSLITFRGKQAADGHRYKALGNSMAVPVMRWILSRIETVTQFDTVTP